MRALDNPSVCYRHGFGLIDITGIPDVHRYPLHHVFEPGSPNLNLQRREGTLWLEFGVASGRTINYIARFTSDTVFGFDSFEGLPETWRDGFEKGAFSSGGELPPVAENVELVRGWFDATLPVFLAAHPEPVSFLHIDCDLYSSTMTILNALKHRLAPDCVVVFDELVNYPGFDGATGELRALSQFLCENRVRWSWIGMNGPPVGNRGYEHENVALCIHGVDV